MKDSSYARSTRECREDMSSQGSVQAKARTLRMGLLAIVQFEFDRNLFPERYRHAITRPWYKTPLACLAHGGLIQLRKAAGLLQSDFTYATVWEDLEQQQRSASVSSTDFRCGIDRFAQSRAWDGWPDDDGTRGRFVSARNCGPAKVFFRIGDGTLILAELKIWKRSRCYSALCRELEVWFEDRPVYDFTCFWIDLSHLKGRWLKNKR